MTEDSKKGLRLALVAVGLAIVAALVVMAGLDYFSGQEVFALDYTVQGD